MRKSQDCDEKIIEKYEKIKNYKKKKYLEYYELHKDEINEKNIDNYHKKMHENGKETHRLKEILKTKEDKINKVVKLLTEIDVTNDDIDNIKNKLKII